jgi:hypothetical protein
LTETTVSEAWAPLATGGQRMVHGPANPAGPLAPVGSPLWWVRRLHARLVARQPLVERYHAYYSGDHPLPWLPSQAQEEFRRVLRMTRTNYMGLVVDAQVERMAVQGFRIGNELGADRETWRIWQANSLDSDIGLAFKEAAKSGTAYLLVGPNPADRVLPLISVEHPSQAIVEYVPGSRRKRAAGLRVWRDDWEAALVAELHLPTRAHRFVAAGTRTSTAPAWREDERAQRPNPAGVVSLVELRNNPDLLVGGVSELYDLTDVQDRVNKTIADRLITQDFGAFPQKWASGWPTEDENGNPTPPIQIGRNRMVTTDVAEAKFGQWDAAPVDPYSLAKREDVKDIASRSRTPAQYLLGEMSNVNGETLKASESGLVAKVRERQQSIDDDLEDAMRIARRLAGIGTGDDVTMETIWRNPEFRTEGETVDALTKMRAMGLPLRAVWERWGASQVEMDRWEAQLAEEQARGALALSALAGFGPDVDAG